MQYFYLRGNITDACSNSDAEWQAKNYWLNLSVAQLMARRRFDLYWCPFDNFGNVYYFAAN